MPSEIFREMCKDPPDKILGGGRGQVFKRKKKVIIKNSIFFTMQNYSQMTTFLTIDAAIRINRGGGQQYFWGDK